MVIENLEQDGKFSTPGQDNILKCLSLCEASSFNLENFTRKITPLFVRVSEQCSGDCKFSLKSCRPQNKVLLSSAVTRRGHA